MAEDFEREERAFTEGLRGSVPVESFRPLDPEELKAAAGPAIASRGRWTKGLAAAAALVVVATAGAVILPQLGGASPSSTTVAGIPEAAGGAAPMDAEDRLGSADKPAEVTRTPGDWSKVSSSPLTPRSYASGAWLGGRFYLVGGQLDAPCPRAASCPAPSQRLRDGASYDPVTGTWQRIATAPVEISETAPVAVLGKLYYRVSSQSGQTVVSYDPAANAWATLPGNAGDGELVAAGGVLVSIGYSDEQDEAECEIYDPASGQWSSLPVDPLGPSFDRRAVWADGKLLLAAKELVSNPGSEKPAVARLAEYDFSTRTWRRLPDSEVIGGGATTVGDLVVWPEPGSADGGEVGNWGRSYPMGGIYHPATGLWTRLPELPAGEGVIQAWSNTSVAGNLLLASGHLLDPAAGTWTELSPPPAGNLLGQSVGAGPDGVLVFGGWDGRQQTAGTFYLPLR